MLEAALMVPSQDTQILAGIGRGGARGRADAPRPRTPRNRRHGDGMGHVPVLGGTCMHVRRRGLRNFAQKQKGHRQKAALSR